MVLTIWRRILVAGELERVGDFDDFGDLGLGNGIIVVDEKAYRKKCFA